MLQGLPAACLQHPVRTRIDCALRLSASCRDLCANSVRSSKVRFGETLKVRAGLALHARDVRYPEPPGQILQKCN
jgi:hypothetical protein